MGFHAASDHKWMYSLTNDGNYKLPNGIIVLVEEDIQSYLEGTLVFNDANSEII